MKGIVLLEDGTYFEGISLGKAEERVGEVILHTSVVGYQEIMTDPANAGKIVVLTYPLIGNYGVAKKFYESRKCWVEGLVIKEKSAMYSNWQAEDSFESLVRQEEVTVIGEIDTRTLAVKIRDGGEMLGILSSNGAERKEFMKKLQERKKRLKRDFIQDISVKEITKREERGSGPHLGILDLGILNSFIAQLTALGCTITLLPYRTSSEEIQNLNLDGVVISGGPEEDEALTGIVEAVKRLIGTIPLLGISTGHQLICRALGGKVKKMKVGHHGVNYPVRSPSSYKGDITVQNHSWVVDEPSLGGRSDVTITLRNVNDETIEEIESVPLKFISTQYYPARPGCNEEHEVFKRFLAMTRK